MNILHVATEFRRMKHAKPFYYTDETPAQNILGIVVRAVFDNHFNR